MPRKAKNKGFVLTDENYYSPEANKRYMSCSQYDDYMTCEAMALAKEHGFYVPEEPKAFALGKYFHSALESDAAFEKFCEEHFTDIFKTRELKSGEIKVSGKYADYELIDRMLECAKNDPVIGRYIAAEGENEVTYTGKLFGKYPWKVRLDKYIPAQNLILDWKTLSDIYETKYDEKRHERVPFTLAYGYYRRAAVYMEIFKKATRKKKDPLFFLVCVSKQDPPDRAVIMMNERQQLDLELDEMAENLPRIWRVKTGKQKPIRCGKCDYCRGTMKTPFLSAYELIPGNNPLLESEYDDLWSRYQFDDGFYE